MDRRLALIGGGTMGCALVAGLVGKAICPPNNILVCEISSGRREELAREFGVSVTDLLKEAPRFAETLVLAVKPVHLHEIGPQLRPFLGPSHVVVSILAGQNRQKLAKVLGPAPQIVRVMPNLPAQVGAGISAVTFGEDTGEQIRSWVREILSAVGEVVEVPEHLQDAVTAVSGSGPGFLFYLAGQMISAAQAAGLPKDVARSLVVQTMQGAAQVLKQSTEEPDDLVRRVATPGGTTEAGLVVLEESNLAGIIRETILRAAERSRELGLA